MSIVANTDCRGLDQRLTFQRVVEKRGARGEVVSSEWADLGTVHARIDAMKAGERFSDAAQRSTSAYTAWIRFEAFRAMQLTPKDRALWNGIPYDIQDMPNQQKRGRLIAVFLQGGMNQG